MPQRLHQRPVAPAPIELIVAAQARGDWDSVTQLLEQHRSSLLRTSRDGMREVVNALPDAVPEAKSRWATARQYLNFAPDDGRVRPARFDFEAAQPNDAGELIDDLAQYTGRTGMSDVTGASGRRRRSQQPPSRRSSRRRRPR